MESFTKNIPKKLTSIETIIKEKKMTEILSNINLHVFLENLKKLLRDHTIFDCTKISFKKTSKAHGAAYWKIFYSKGISKAEDFSHPSLIFLIQNMQTFKEFIWYLWWTIYYAPSFLQYWLKILLGIIMLILFGNENITCYKSTEVQ